MRTKHPVINDIDTHKTAHVAVAIDTQGKTDSLEVEDAARSLLSGQATARPKTQTGSSEMITHLKIADDTAFKSGSQTLKVLIINAPVELPGMLGQIIEA